ncbi:hypothetical protein RJT34_01525 [Clitoria ternatea]|uniref:Peptidase S26 domain-containing protein n=1 Tax=Clitoria ternatea TaxID=43366 RepID=A0AAN9KKE1_CLITE
MYMGTVPRNSKIVARTHLLMHKSRFSDFSFSPVIPFLIHSSLRATSLSKQPHLWPFVSIVKEAWEKAFIVAKVLCFSHVVDTYLIGPVVTYGPSMLPTMDSTEELYLAEKISTRFSKVACGDIIILSSPEDPRKYITKRVVGMEGDSVTYISNPKSTDTDNKHGMSVVPKGHIWVQGDNIYKSRDSRNFGPVPYGLIRGKIFWKLSGKGFGPFWNK